MDPTQNQQNNQQTPVPVIPPVEETNQIPETPIVPSTPEIATTVQPEVPPTISGISDSISTSDSNSGKKPKGKLYAAIAGVVLLLVSIPLGIFLVNQNQEIRNKAAGSDPNHCGTADGKRLENGGTTANCTGWDQNNKSCESDAVNFYYFSSCPPTAAKQANPDNAEHCAASDGVRYSGGKPTNIKCDMASYRSGNDNQCPGKDSENPYYYDTCPNTGQNASDKAHCAGSDYKRREQGKDTGIVCSGWQQANKSCALDLENPYYYDSCPPASGGQAQITGYTLEPATVAYGQTVKISANISGGTAVKGHVRIWPDDKDPVIDGGKITGNGSVNFDTSKLPAGTKSARIRLQAQNASDADIKPDVAQDLTLTISGSGGGAQITNYKLEPQTVVYGQPVKVSANISGGTAVKGHLRIWPDDPSNKPVVDGGKIAGNGSITFDTNKLPVGTKTALFRLQAQDASDKDIKPDVAPDLTLTITAAPPVAGDSRCTTLELVRNNSIIYQNDGGVAPQIKIGDQLTFNVYCFTADSTDDYDYFRISVTKPDGTALTNDPVAARAQSRDSGSNRFFMASYSLTVDSLGSYTIKGWGHMKKALWKGSN